MQASQPHHVAHIQETKHHSITSVRTCAHEDIPIEGLFHVEHYTSTRTTHIEERQRSTHVPRGTRSKTSHIHKATTHPAQETRIFAAEETN